MELIGPHMTRSMDINFALFCPHRAPPFCPLHCLDYQESKGTQSGRGVQTASTRAGIPNANRCLLPSSKPLRGSVVASGGSWVSELAEGHRRARSVRARLTVERKHDIGASFDRQTI